MVSNVEKARPNNEMLVSKDQNCNEMTVGNTSGRISHQYGVSTVIKR